MAGIYVHIPYCKQKCSYCNFHFSVSQIDKTELLSALKKEIIHRRDYLKDEDITSIYFGGGTPSILSAWELTELISSIKSVYEYKKDLEITLEANPDDLNKDVLEHYLSLGINRLSIGIQSFDEEELRLMNRAHTAKEALNCVKLAQDTGFKNLSIDLIYGIPNQSMEKWNRNIDIALALNIQHISAYALTVEPKTALQHQVNKGKITMPEEEKVSDHFLALRERLLSNKFEQYEVSNFALQEWYSQHNSSYWKSTPYIGIGPSAHSFDGHTRQWNVANNKKYISALEAGNQYFDIEKITKQTAFNEYIMLGLRTKWGIDPSVIKDKFNLNIRTDFPNWISKYASYFTKESNKIVLNGEGLLIADRIASDLMIID